MHGSNSVFRREEFDIDRLLGHSRVSNSDIQNVSPFITGTGLRYTRSQGVSGRDLSLDFLLRSDFLVYRSRFGDRFFVRVQKSLVNTFPINSTREEPDETTVTLVDMEDEGDVGGYRGVYRTA